MTNKDYIKAIADLFIKYPEIFENTDYVNDIIDFLETDFNSNFHAGNFIDYINKGSRENN